MQTTSIVRALLGIAATALVAAPAAAQDTLTSERVLTGLSRPIALKHAGDPDRAFVVEQRGLIRVLDLTTDTLLAEPFLDLTALVSSSGNERGLLGLAFHPDYADNGLFYVNYTMASGGDTVVAQYTVSADPDIADPGSAFQILWFDQPFSNHNGGWIGFGPDDGYLYIGTGDGGSANDPGNRAQDTTNQWLGKMLRVDVNDDDFPGDPDMNYAVPPSNPFVGVSGDDEIWAYGLRNPWRCSFDSETGDLWMGDVGQNNWEEIDFQPAASLGGENYGWRCMEGTHCTGLTGCTCDAPELTMPVHEYSHSDGCSVTGGVVYRGAAIPHLRGTYFFSDFCTSRLWTFRYDGTDVTEFADRTDELAPDVGSIGSVSAFGEDANGELYICDLGGELYRLLPRCRADVNGDAAVNTQDVLLFLNLWNANDPAADFTGDGQINTQDVLEFLNQWNAGCP